MSAPAHIVFDRPLARLRLARAHAQGAASFLLDHIAAEFPERLSAILRPFPRVLDLGTPGPALMQALTSRPSALLVHAGPVPAALDGGVRLVADEEALPFAPASFDLVVSALQRLYAANDPTRVNPAIASDNVAAPMLSRRASARTSPRDARHTPTSATQTMRETKRVTVTGMGHVSSMECTRGSLPELGT